ncbi:MAG: hypothetical protein J6I50_00650 [Clostridia bacterium]|nr:hypothetical protein [Clostridia bacterium]
MGAYEVDIQEDGVPTPPRRTRRPKKHLSTAQILLYTLIAALVCVILVFAAIYASGLRYIKLNTEIGGYVKFFGTVDSTGNPFKGDLYYSDGTTAKVDMLNHKVTFSNGDTYTGTLNASLRMEGTGKLEYSTGDVYEGAFENGVISGNGVFRYANGDVYEGGFLNGGKNGQGVYKWFDGSTYTGEFSDDKKNGNGVYIWSDGSSYTGEYVNELKEGTGTYRFANGDVYSGEFKADARTGQGTYTWANGDEYIGTFEDNEMNGTGTYRFASGRTFEGRFENGVLVRDLGNNTDDNTAPDSFGDANAAANG